MFAMGQRRRLCALFMVSLFAFPCWAKADALMVTKAMTASTIAELFVEERTIRVELDIGVKDLDAFRNIMPDELYERLGHEPKPLVERIERFFSQDWVIRADGGEPLVGRIERMEPGRRIQRDEITGEPLPVQPEDAEVVVRVGLIYSFDKRPKTLSVEPPRREEASFVAANVGFVVYHMGVAVNDFRYLGQEEMLDLDWDDPWYSTFRNRNLRRQYNAPLSAFLYVEHFEVRKEIVARPKDLQQWIDLGLEGKTVITVADQEELKQKVAEFLMPRGIVEIDGKRIEPILDRIHFIRRTLRRTGIVDPPEDLDINSAMLGVIFVYPINGLPQEATLTWDLFGPRIQKVASTATDEAGGLPNTLTPDDPVLKWQNFLKNPRSLAMRVIDPPPSPLRLSVPVLSALCVVLALVLGVTSTRRARVEQRMPRKLILSSVVMLVCGLICLPYTHASFTVPFTGASRIKPDEAKSIVGGLLYNIYRSFDRRDESVIYDRLASSLKGDILSDVYLQTRRSMELESQGGARVKVDEVDVLEAVTQESTGQRGFVCRCRWNVSGSVGHWGHIHRRTNQYDAVFTVEPVEDVWKIAAIDLREEKRVTPGQPR